MTARLILPGMMKSGCANEVEVKAYCATTVVSSRWGDSKLRLGLTLLRSSGTAVVESLQGTSSRLWSRCSSSPGRSKPRSAGPPGVPTSIKFPKWDVRQSDVIVGEIMASLPSCCGLASPLTASLSVRKLSDRRVSEAHRSLSRVLVFLVPGGLPMRALKL
jgi:hypothetical protein